MTISVQCDTAGRRSVLKPSFTRLGRRGVCPYKKKRDRQFGPFTFGVRVCLFNVDGLAVGIKASLDANFLAFVLFQRFLMINIVGLAAGVLENVLVA
jgi:hypothetical protein